MSVDTDLAAALLAVEDLTVVYSLGRGRRIEAVAGISFAIARGEALGLVGESGCGKTTVARAIVGLQRATGRIHFDGHDLAGCDAAGLRALRPRMQMIFQDAAASLNPGRSIGRSVAEPLRVLGGLARAERLARAREMIRAVGLDPDLSFDLRPYAFSGGQCQRISIARALILDPHLLICDEPVSSLDVSTRAQILNLLAGMRQRLGLTLLFISHDLAVVKNICDRVAVMYLGRLCEIATTEDLFRSPRHPYTAALLAAIPALDRPFPPPSLGFRANRFPSPLKTPKGCRFYPRCPRAEPRCQTESPPMRAVVGGRQVACHFPLEAS